MSTSYFYFTNNDGWFNDYEFVIEGDNAIVRNLKTLQLQSMPIERARRLCKKLLSTGYKRDQRIRNQFMQIWADRQDAKAEALDGAVTAAEDYAANLADHESMGYDECNDDQQMFYANMGWDVY